MSEFDGRITELYGERCPDHEPSCACCVVWDMRDRIEAQAKEIEALVTEQQWFEQRHVQQADCILAQAKEIAELKAALAATQRPTCRDATEPCGACCTDVERVGCPF